MMIKTKAKLKETPVEAIYRRRRPGGSATPPAPSAVRATCKRRRQTPVERVYSARREAAQRGGVQ